MYQCLGLGTAEDGGCGEDWWHPSCIVGLGPEWDDQGIKTHEKTSESTDVATNGVATVAENPDATQDADDDDPPPPPGFPHEDDFDQFICWKCVDANSWIKLYAGTPGFLPPVFKLNAEAHTQNPNAFRQSESVVDIKTTEPSMDSLLPEKSSTAKRKACDDEDDNNLLPSPKRARSSTTPPTKNSNDHSIQSSVRHDSLPPAPSGTMSLFLKEDFRQHFCRCPDCFPNLAPHSQLLEEEESYEPPISESGDDAGTRSAGTGSLLERGEAALSNVDRVRAIGGFCS